MSSCCRTASATRGYCRSGFELRSRVRQWFVFWEGRVVLDLGHIRAESDYFLGASTFVPGRTAIKNEATESDLLWATQSDSSLLRAES